MKTIRVPAETGQLSSINDSIGAVLAQYGCSSKTQMEIELAVEEIFVNIASYAYPPGTGEAEIQVEAGGDPPSVTIRFLDSGKPFDPLARPEVDVTASAESRRIGGLGIHLVKRLMDQTTYAHEDGKNILTIRKTLS
ncbi:ATP-binding protein [Pseudoflavonifractor sp. MSJ-37]|uniref:ATP-binding protein n=1 Tax=Pseudoflavonifractor sp. MSJ-37 TaxID=2841531 RepID=UPI001C0FB3F6|nr:ATP-binding protein [Pseudoflavonifractor sp. MSJ-37]MBU5434060.1 ATP-binding protein [Pseudoflavonifractor sp. MSJ-37]